MNARTGPDAGGIDAVRRLVAPHPSLGVPVPAYEGRSAPNLLSSVVRALGGEPPVSALPPLEPSLDPFHERRAEGPVLVFVVDGLGYLRLREHVAGGAAGPVRDWPARAVPVTTVFPSTTPVALLSLATASSPSRHGVVGYRLFLPRFGSVVEVLRMSPLGSPTDEALVGPLWNRSSLTTIPTIFQGAVPGAVAVSRDRFEGQAFSRAMFDGATYEPYSAGADLAAVLTHLLDRPTPPPLVVAYWDELDIVQHLRGPASAAVGLEIDRVAALLDHVARSGSGARRKDVTVIVTADHGVVPIEPAAQLAAESEPEVAALLARPPSGDRRAGLFKARAGKVDELEGALLRRLPAGARVLRSEEAIRHGLFGPPPFHPELAERVGDLVTLVPSPAGITYTLPGRSPTRRHLVGAHGGLEAEELVVPLVAGTLGDFRASPAQR